MNRIARLLFCAVALATAAPVAAQSVKAGIEAWQKSDYAGAVAIWRPLAEKGDPDAAFNLGQAYRLGRGVPTNLSAAQTWLDRAAEKGHLDAQTTLGLLLFDSGNRVTGLRWLKQAAERGDPRALLVYGTALFNGDGLVRDPVLAYAYVSRAAAQGLEPAKATLAELDKLIPLDLRKKGIALAQQKAAAKPSQPAKVSPPAKTAAKVAKAAPIVPPPAKVAASLAPSSGGWRIQLGAFAKRASAEALFRSVSGTLSGRQAYYVPVGAITRLQVGPFASKSEATAACARLAGKACFAVAAK